MQSPDTTSCIAFTLRKRRALIAKKKRDFFLKSIRSVIAYNADDSIYIPGLYLKDDVSSLVMMFRFLNNNHR